MRYKWSLILIVIVACSSPTRQDAASYIRGEKIYDAVFEQSDSASWVIESETPVDPKEVVKDGALVLNVPSGITVWNTTRFEGNVLFEFDVMVIDSGGVNDRVSDLNCFWMATDPAFPDHFFERSAWRGGVFWNYYSLNLYYVGFGGHDNTKTRMRRYDAAIPPPPPVLKEYDDPDHLIRANKRNTVRIVCMDSGVSYYFNKELLFDIQEGDPYTEGYFGFRTTHNHMKIDRFAVYRVRPAAASEAAPPAGD